MHLSSLVNLIPSPPRFFMKTLTSSCRPPRTSSTHLLPHLLPRDLKTTIVKPLLKKPSLDKNLLENYRPISNLSFLSKILEKVVLHKLLSRLPENNLSNPFQSAYRAGHNTPTVSSRVHLILSSNLAWKFRTLLQDLLSWHPVTTTQHLSWKNCTGFPFQNVLSIKSLVCVSVL